MYFVGSWWYLVLALLLVGIVVLTVIYFMMDKKDRMIIKEFVDSSAPQKTDLEKEPTEAEKKSE